MNKQTILAIAIALAFVGGAMFLGARDNSNRSHNARGNLTAIMESMPKSVTAGATTELTFTLKGERGDAPNLMEHHARILHVLIVGEGMSTFAHLHPEDFGGVTDTTEEDGKYSVKFRFPKAGNYLIGIDAMAESGEFAEQFIISVSGSDTLAQTEATTSSTACFDGFQEDGHDRYIEAVEVTQNEPCENAYRVSLSHAPDILRSQEPATFTFTIERDGQPVEDLEPYLDAGLHLTVVLDDMSDLIHSHGEPMGPANHHSSLIPVAYAHEDGMDMDAMDGMIHDHEALPNAFGPTLVSESIVFPKEGRYYLFGQFKHEGNIVFTKFAVDVQKGAETSAQFEHLSEQTSNSCGGGKQVVYGLPEDGRLQGSCCGSMDMHSYQEQIAGLKAKYSGYDIIPSDPYDVPVSWARQMIEYSEQTTLTPEQQAVYDEAVGLSEEGGPCCCVCWHWYAYEGLAKHLIVNESFSAEQIAEVWDLSDACGGDHHHH